MREKLICFAAAHVLCSVKCAGALLFVRMVSKNVLHVSGLKVIRRGLQRGGLRGLNPPRSINSMVSGEFSGPNRC